MARPIDTKAAARRISGHLNGLVRDFATLVRGLQESAEQAAKKSAAASRGAARPRRALTAKDHARLKLQGEYLGLMRHLPKKHHVRVKELRAKNGYPPAIKLARRLLDAKG
jgi:predicted transcriptional regulator